MERRIQQDYQTLSKHPQIPASLKYDLEENGWEFAR